MPSLNVVHLAYAVMVLGIVLCFVLTRNQKKDMRKTVDGFALPFVKLSNYVCPSTLAVGLAVEELDGGKVRVLPDEEQPEAIRFLKKRALNDKSVKLFAEMVEAADQIAKIAGGNRTAKRQFSAPIQEILQMTHIFLVGCENPATIDTMEKKQCFDSFLQEQVKHRMVLLRGIRGATSDEFQKLNHAYADEMEAQELEEAQAKRRRGKAPKEAAEK